MMLSVLSTTILTTTPVSVSDIYYKLTTLTIFLQFELIWFRKFIEKSVGGVVKNNFIYDELGLFHIVYYKWIEEHKKFTRIL